MGYVIAVILGFLWTGDAGADNSFLTAAVLFAIVGEILIHK